MERITTYDNQVDNNLILVLDPDFPVDKIEGFGRVGNTGLELYFSNKIMMYYYRTEEVRNRVYKEVRNRVYKYLGDRIIPKID